MGLYAIGDIHGCFEQMRTMIEDKIAPTAEDTIILLGDYIDRGSRSREVIEYLMRLQSAGFNLILLRGNHEEMLVNAITDPHKTINWLWNGGTETLRSFGITHPADFDPRYKDFFSNLSYWHSAGDYLFVHAGFNDNAENPFEDQYSMVWTRREQYSHPMLKNRIIIHGHTPVTVDACIKNTRNNTGVINIDTGCVYEEQGYGHLTSVSLPSGELFIV